MKRRVAIEDADYFHVLAILERAKKSLDVAVSESGDRDTQRFLILRGGEGRAQDDSN
jgi:hypothetical protein